MHNRIDWTNRPLKGVADGHVRYYVAVQSTDPERVRLQRWEILILARFDAAVTRAKAVRMLPEHWACSCVIRKDVEGSIQCVWFDASPLTGWVEMSGYSAWGAHCLIGALSNLENEAGHELTPGTAYVAWVDDGDGFYPRLMATRLPATQWPLAADYGRRSDAE